DGRFFRIVDGIDGCIHFFVTSLDRARVFLTRRSRRTISSDRCSIAVYMSAVDKAGRPTHWCLYLFRVAPAPILLALCLLGIAPFGVAEEPDWVELPITPDAYQE